MKKIIAYVTSHGHMDIEWYQPLDTYRYWMSEALELLAEYQKDSPKQSYILDGSFFPLEAVLKLHPEYEDKLRTLVESRKLLVGPFYTQFDEFLNSGETIIENCLYGGRLSKNFGHTMKAGYLPDNFGHPSQLPQILRSFGIDNLLFTRGMVNTEHEKKEFRFIGDDGSELYGINFAYYATFSIYTNNSPRPGTPNLIPNSKYILTDYQVIREISEHRDNERIARELINNVREHAKYYPSGVVPMFMGCDHCPPQKDILKTLALANSLQNEIEFVFGDADGYSELLRKSFSKEADSFKGNLLGLKTEYVLLGAMSSRTYLKRMHDTNEHILFDYALPAHLFASLAGISEPETMLDDSLRKLLLNSTHDTIHGSSLDTVHVEQEYRYSTISQNGMWTFHSDLDKIGCKMTLPETKTDGTFVVLNPLGTKDAVCETYVVNHGKNIILRDGFGKKVPYDILPNQKMEYHPTGEPALTPTVSDEVKMIRFPVHGNGMLEKFTYELLDTEEQDVKNEEIKSIENAYYVVTLKDNTIDILDKVSGVKYKKLNQFIDIADAGDIWDFSDPWVESKEYCQDDFEMTDAFVTAGRFSSSITYRFHMLLPEKLENGARSSELVKSAFSITVTIYNDVKRIDVKVNIENRSKDHALRLRIPDVENESSILTGGLFTVQHLDPAIYLDCKNNVGTASNREMPFRDFVSYKNEGAGLVTAIKGLYTYEYKNNAIEIPLFRAVNKMTRPNTKGRKPGSFSSSLPIDDAECIRDLSFEFSYMPMDKSTSVEDTLDTVYSYLRAPFAHHLRYTNNCTGEISQCFNPISFKKSKNVVVSIIRKGFDGDGAVLRVYEAVGKQGKIEISSDIFTKFALVTMNEDHPEPIFPDKDGKLTVEVKPHKIITIMMKEN